MKALGNLFNWNRKWDNKFSVEKARNVFSIFDSNSELKRQLKQRPEENRNRPKRKRGFSSVIYEAWFISSCTVYAVFS